MKAVSPASVNSMMWMRRLFWSRLRWALYEAAQIARRGERSPDREYYLATKERIGGNRACLSVARKQLKRSYHRLREPGEEALQPA
jgi:transposase